MAYLANLPKNPAIGSARLVADLIANDEALRAALNSVDNSQLAAGAALANIGAGGLTSGYLAAGAALANLAANSVGVSKLATVPYVEAYATGTQANSGSLFPVLFDAESWDTDGMHSTSSNTGRLTCVTDGLYLVCARATFAANAGGTYRGMRLFISGSANRDAKAAPLGAGNDVVVEMVFLTRLVAGQYLEMMALHDVGGSINMTTGFSGRGTALSAIRLSA